MAETQEPAGSSNRPPGEKLPPSKDVRPGDHVPAGSSAQNIAPRFGGLRSGRARLDGLIPGSKEAFDADRKRDAARHRERYHAAKNADPAPLPGVKNGRPLRPVTIPVTPQALPVSGDIVVAPNAFVPWEAKTLEPIFAQLIPAAEALDVRSLVARAEKAKLPGALCKEIEKDARWPELAAKSLELSAPQLVAKWFNYFGLSSENAPEVVCGAAVLSILASRLMLLRRIDKAIAELNTPPGGTPPGAAAAAPGAGPPEPVKRA